MKLNTSVFVLLAAAAVAASATVPQGRPTAPAGVQGDTAALRVLMWQKASRAEAILRGLAQGDLQTVQTAADQLVQIAARARWSATDSRRGRFAVYEAEFQRRAAQLAKVAREKDLHGAYYQFLQVLFTCFDCHEELRPTSTR